MGFLAILGVVLLVVAGVLLWIRRSKEARLHAILRTRQPYRYEHPRAA